MKKVGIFFVILLFLLVVWFIFQQVRPVRTTKSEIKEKTNEEDSNRKAEKIHLRLLIHDHTFLATLEDNETTQEFVKRLPFELDMSELNGNEKYYYLEKSLPSHPVPFSQIEVGDLMLYGEDCLVLFYEAHRTSYSYTKIGKVDDPTGLASVVGSGNVSVKFEVMEAVDKG